MLLQDWFLGIYTFYFPHSERYADHWDIGAEYGGSRWGQITFDFHKFLHPILNVKEHELTYRGLDKYAATIKLSWHALPSLTLFGGFTASWIQKIDRETINRKDKWVLGIQWVLDRFVAAEFQTFFDTKKFHPTGFLKIRIQANRLDTDKVYSQHFLRKPPQRNTPFRYYQYYKKTNIPTPSTVQGDKQQDLKREASKNVLSEEQIPCEPVKAPEEMQYTTEYSFNHLSDNRVRIERNSTHSSSVDETLRTFEPYRGFDEAMSQEDSGKMWVKEYKKYEKGTTPWRRYLAECTVKEPDSTS